MECIAKLSEFGADLEVATNKGSTPLQYPINHRSIKHKSFYKYPINNGNYNDDDNDDDDDGDDGDNGDDGDDGVDGDDGDDEDDSSSSKGSTLLL